MCDCVRSLPSNGFSEFYWQDVNNTVYVGADVVDGIPVWVWSIHQMSNIQVRANMRTAGYRSFHHMAQCAVHVLKGLACRARVTPASSPASAHARVCVRS